MSTEGANSETVSLRDKEIGLFSTLGEEYLNWLVYFELENSEHSIESQDESLLKDSLSKIDSIQNIYILYSNKSILIVCKPNTDLELLKQKVIQIVLNTVNLNLIFKQIPSSRFVLISELTDSHLNIISNDKSVSLKLIESKTGLRLRKIKKSFYFAGLNFQFCLLDQILKDYSLPVQIEQAKSSWKSLYNGSEIKFSFKINQYDIYVFQADLTDLDTDCLVNVTHSNLHPGYEGDGVSRRIREKGGKQLQDACKRLLQSKQEHLLEDSEVCYTKASGKLKSKHVLHAVCPSWTKYFSSVMPSVQQSEKFEQLVKNTFENILKQAHDTKLNLNSIAFPACSSPNGGAFDLPLDLFAHLFYTQIASYQMDTSNASSLNTICLVSLESSVIKSLIDILSMYSDMCSTTLWAAPENPLNKLLQQQFALSQQQAPQSLLKIQTQPSKAFEERILQNKNSNFDSKFQVEKDGSIKIIRNMMQKAKLFSVQDGCCLFCQKENNNNLNTSSTLVVCGNDKCKAAFCELCLYNYVNRHHTNKCPGCRIILDKNLLETINNNYNSASSSSSSSSISPTRIVNNSSNSGFSLNQRRPQMNTFHNIKYPITEAKIYIRKLDEPCAGYEHYKSLLITFEISDGIQNEKHPKPGQAYKGTTKRAYLPNVKEHMEILSFYEKALKAGMLFKLDWNRNFGDYRVHLNQDVLLKTSPNGGGRFGYPDANYIDDLLKMARTFKS